ncbi:hypothetical protein ACQRAH_05030 [Limosilactobacillus reuteri]|nr:hypothetical protein [Limosilactobacillus reuteri]
MGKEQTHKNNQPDIETVHASIDPEATEEEREEIIKWIENLKKQK